MATQGSWERRMAKALGAEPVNGGTWEKAFYQKLLEISGQTDQLVPTGGTTGQVLKRDPSGDAVWGTDLTGASDTWDFFATSWSTTPTINQTIAGGTVYDYTLDGTTRYRFVPDPYDPATDGFYSTFSAGTLSGLIVTRG